MTALYKDGTISLVNGSPIITGIDTAWKVSLIVGGTVFVEADGGNPLPILPDDSTGANLHPITDTQMTSAINWTGPSGTFNYALVRETSYNRQQTTNAEKLGELLSQLDSPMLAGLSSIEGMPDHLILITGPSTASLIPRLSLIQGVGFDKAVANLAARAAYNGEVKGFRVAVTDIGDGRSAVYEKNSNTSGDWSTPVVITGPAGPSGVTQRGSYSAATCYAARDLVQFGGSSWIAKVATTGNPPPALPAIENTQWLLFARSGTAGVADRGTYSAASDYAANDIVLDNGSTWIALQATKGNAPPALPTESNAYWRVLARAGKDGAGTGDVVGPNGGVTAKQVAGFGTATGKTLIGLTPAEVRAAADAGVLGGFRNKIINGNFSIWQRGTTQTTTGYGSCDRWKHNHNGSTKTVSQQPIGPGAFAFEDRFYCRTVVSSVVGAANYVGALYAVEDVRTFAGKKVTLTFWARTTGTDKPIAIELAQLFGTGGSPSAALLGIDVKKVVLSSTLGVGGFQKYSLTFEIPSISGKTIGTNDDSSLTVVFWFDAGSNFNDRTLSLGQQSGTFDIAHVSLVEGDATGESDPFSPRHPQQELELCQRYYQVLYFIVGTSGLSNSNASINQTAIPVRMRATPSQTVTFDGGTGATFSLNPLISGIRQDSPHSGLATANIRLDAEL